MAFEINGSSGMYDGKVKDDSVKYGRNAAANHAEFVTSPLKGAMSGEAPMLNFMPTQEAQEENIEKLSEFIKSNDTYLNSLPPLEYEYRYMPKPQNNVIDKRALYGAAYEEMGEKTEIPVETFENDYLPDNTYTAKPLDLNNDGNIDVAEYGASMLAADMLSKPIPRPENIDGSMNSIGMDAVMEYAKKSNAEAATKLYSKMYSSFKLNEVV